MKMNAVQRLQKVKNFIQALDKMHSGEHIAITEQLTPEELSTLVNFAHWVKVEIGNRIRHSKQNAPTV